MAWPVATVDECVNRLFSALWSQSRQLDPLVSEWLTKGLLESARQGITLDEALGLSGGGRRTLRRRLQTVQRDLHLAHALDVVALSADVCTAWERCTRLAPLAGRFAADTWPRVRAWDSPPSDWPAWKCALFRAAKTGLPLPTSARGLADAWKRAAPYSLPRPAGTVLALFI